MKSKIWKTLQIVVMITVLLISALPQITTAATKDIYILSTTTDVSSITQNSNFVLTLVMENKSNTTLSAIRVDIPTGDFALSNGTTSQLVAGSYAPGASIPVVMGLVYLGDGTDNQLNLKISYDANGTPDSQDDSVRLLGVKKTVVNETPNPNTLLPKLAVDNQAVKEVMPGIEQIISYDLKNSGAYQATNIVVKPVAGSGLSGKIDFATSSFLPSDLTINPSTSTPISLKFTVNALLPSGTYPLTLEYTYKNSLGSAFTSEQTIYIKVVNSNVKPTLYLDNVVFNPSTPVPGQDMTLSFNVKNKGTLEAKDVSVAIKDLSATQFILKDNQVIKQLGTIKGISVAQASFKYSVKANTTGGSYPATIVITYTDTDGSEKKIESAYNLYIPGTTESGTADVRVDGITYPTHGVAPEDSFKVGFTLNNLGDLSAKKIKVSIKSSGAFVSKTQSIITTAELKAGASQSYNFTLTSSKDVTTQNIPIVFEIAYADGNSADPIIFEQAIGVYVEANMSSEQAKKSVPKIIVSRYETVPIIVNAGEQFDLSLAFLNTHPLKTVKNIKAFLTVNENTSELGNIFRPVDSSNTFFIDEISPKGTYETSLKMYTIPDAKPKTYTVTVNFDYEDEEGNPYTATELIGINVTQPTQLEITDIVPPMEAYPGQPFPLSFNFYNTGKVKVFNLMIKVEGDFTSDNPSYYVGNFEPGAQEYYEGFVTPNQAGQLMGKAIISYDEPSGEKITIEKEFSVNVVDMMIDPGMVDPGMVDPGMNPEGQPTGLFANKWVKYGAIGGGILLVIIIIVVVRVILKKRRDKLDEI